MIDQNLILKSEIDGELCHEMNNTPSPRIINCCIDTHGQSELRLSVQFRLLMTICCFKSYNLITLTNNRLKITLKFKFAQKICLPRLQNY